MRSAAVSIDISSEIYYNYYNTIRKVKIMAIKVFISKDKKQFKANLHCHSTISDGRLTPEELKAAYKNAG